MVADFGAREERSAGWKPALQIGAEAAAVGERDEWLDGASSCGRLAKRARYIVPLHMRTERSAGWKPALQISAEAAAVGERDEWLDDASSCGWLAKRARYIVPLHVGMKSGHTGVAQRHLNG